MNDEHIAYMNGRRDFEPASGGTNHKRKENEAYERGIKERDKAAEKEKPFDWRKHLKVHPAAECFPLLKDIDPEGFKAFVADIKRHGMRERIRVWHEDDSILDGRNRLDAAAELLSDPPKSIQEFMKRLKAHRAIVEVIDSGDPYALVASWNAHRRHLTSEMKAKAVAELLAKRPDLSDRQIAKATNSNRTTVGQIRKEGEAKGDVSIIDTRKDSAGRQQPASKRRTPEQVQAALESCMRSADAIFKSKGLKPQAEPAPQPQPAPGPAEHDIAALQKTAALAQEAIESAQAIKQHIEKKLPPPTDDAVVAKVVARIKELIEPLTDEQRSEVLAHVLAHLKDRASKQLPAG